MCVGVGNHPYSGSTVRGAEVRCSDNTPFRIEPQVGKVGEYPGETTIPVTESLGVLDDDPARPDNVDDTGELGPEPSLRALAPCGSLGDVLAGEPSGEKIDPRNSSSDLGNVSVAGNVGPVTGEDSLTVGIRFRVPEDTHPGSLQSAFDPTDS